MQAARAPDPDEIDTERLVAPVRDAIRELADELERRVSQVTFQPTHLAARRRTNVTQSRSGDDFDHRLHPGLTGYPHAPAADFPQGPLFPAQIGAFFATVPLEGRLDRILLVACRANGQPVLAAYADEEDTGRFDAYGVMVFAIEGNRIAGITGFPRQPELLTRLGLPTRIDETRQGAG